MNKARRCHQSTGPWGQREAEHAPGGGEEGEAGPAILGRGSLEALKIVGSISSKTLRLRRGGGLPIPRAISVESVGNPEAAKKGLGSEWEVRKKQRCVQTSFLECVGL